MVVVIFGVLAVDIGDLRRSSWCVSLGMKGIVVVVVVAVALLDDVGVGGAVLRNSPFVRRRSQALMFAGPKVIRGADEKQAQGKGNPPSLR